MCDAFTDATTPAANPPSRALQLQIVTDQEIAACKIPGDIPLWHACGESVWGKRCGIIAHYQVIDKGVKKILCYHHCFHFLRDNKRKST